MFREITSDTKRRKIQDSVIFDLSKKSILIDEYRRSWAQRYIREAKADLEEAERDGARRQYDDNFCG